jgi:two-component system, cell cycle sensor histidine kinase and response regulator CckA
MFPGQKDAGIFDASIQNHQSCKQKNKVGLKKETVMTDVLINHMFEDIVETIPHPLLVLDLDLRILKVNHFFCETFKIAPEKTTGNFIYDLGNRQWDIPKLRRLLEDIISKDHKFENFEVEHIFPSIGRRIMMLNGRRLKQHGTGSQMILLCIEDITEKREMENALIESEERYRRVFETASDAIFLLEKNEGKITYTNPAVTTTLGYPDEECIGKKVQDFDLAHEMDDIQVITERLKKDGIIHYNDVPIQTKVGQSIDTDIYLVDKAALVQCNIRDITERKEAEKALRGTEESFRNLIEILPIGVALSVPDGTITEMNAAMVKIFGYDSKEELQKVPGPARYVNPKDRERYIELLEKSLVKDFEARYRRKDGSVFWGRATAIKRSTATGEIQFINVFEDITERHLAEQALRESEEEYRNLFENLYDVYYSTDPTGLISIASPSVERLLGYKSDEIIGLDLKSLYVNPQEREEFLSQIMRNGSVDDFQAQLRRKDNSVIWVSTNSKILKDEKGNFLGVEGLARDVSERKRAEEDLKESEERYRALFDRSFDCVYVNDFEGNFIDANDTALNILGYDREEIRSVKFASLLSEDQLPLAFQVLTEIKETGYHKELVEFSLKRKDGRIVYVESKSSVIYRDEEPFAILGIARDITERKHAEEALRESEEKYRTILESMGEAYFEVDLEGNFTFFNDALPLSLGYSKEELKGMNNRDYMPPETAKEIYNLFNEIYKTGRPIRGYSYEVIRKDGAERFHELVASLMRDGNGKPIGFRGISHDITERKRAEEGKRKLEAQLNQAQKMEAIGILAGGVAHDFNNLLTSIIGYAELALMDLGKNSRVNQSLDEILKAGHRAAGLTRQLLAFSRKELIRPEVLNFNSLIMNFEKMLRRLIREDIDIVSVCSPDLWQVEADPGQMEQVVMNLAVNARDAMPKGGKLTIETANVELNEDYFRDHGVENQAGPYVMLAVTDTGTGMDKETRARIFEPFFTTKGLGRGTGLGLSTVYGIVKQNKGHIWVYSEPEKGTTFKVYFPRVGVETEVAKREEVPVRSLEGSETILVTEDDELLRKMAERMLEGYGYRVITAENGKEAIKIAGSHDGPVHLLLTDVVMPGMTGLDLAEQLKSRFPEIKVLYMSGYTDNVIADHGVLEKDVNFIQKPFSREGLGGKVREVLDKKQH